MVTLNRAMRHHLEVCSLEPVIFQWATVGLPAKLNCIEILIARISLVQASTWTINRILVVEWSLIETANISYKILKGILLIEIVLARLCHTPHLALAVRRHANVAILSGAMKRMSPDWTTHSRCHRITKRNKRNKGIFIKQSSPKTKISFVTCTMMENRRIYPESNSPCMCRWPSLRLESTLAISVTCTKI